MQDRIHTDASLHFSEFDDFVIIAYNIHSLMNFEERIAWLLKEIGDRKWDLIVFSETWRSERVEVWRTEGDTLGWEVEAQIVNEVLVFC